MAAPLLAVTGGAEAAKLASSVTAHLFAALGTPLLQSQTVATKTTKRGMKTTTTGFSIPAWAVVAGAVIVLASGLSGGGGGTPSRPWWLPPWFPWP